MFCTVTERTWFDCISLLVMPCITIMWQIKKPWNLDLDLDLDLLRLKSARKRWVTWCLDAPPSNRLPDPDLRQRMALPSGEIFPGLPRLGLLLLLLDRSQTSGGRCGAPAGSAKVSGEARDATLARPRLLSRLPDDRREGGERESSPAPKRPKFSCPNVCVLSVHSIKIRGGHRLIFLI